MSFFLCLREVSFHYKVRGGRLFCAVKLALLNFLSYVMCTVHCSLQSESFLGVGPGTMKLQRHCSFIVDPPLPILQNTLLNIVNVNINTG